MLTIQAAIFDMDGTLVDSLMLWDVLHEASEKAYPDKKGTVISEEDNRRIRVLPLTESMKILHDHYGLGADTEELIALTESVFFDFYSHKVYFHPVVMIYYLPRQTTVLGITSTQNMPM